MFEKSSGTAVRRGGRGGAAAAGASLAAHLLLLLGVSWSYRPAPHAPSGWRTPPQEEAVYFDLPPVPSSVALRTPAAASPERATGRVARAPAAAPRDAGARAELLPPTDALPTVPSPPAEERPGSLRATGRTDPRLAVGSRDRDWMDPALSAERRVAEDTLEHWRRGIRILGPGVLPYRDTTVWLPRKRRMIVNGDRPIMPTDGRAWEARELNRLEVEAARDAYLRERARATREREDAKRGTPEAP
jgi:hypothetical protein